jgi:hypothetical protein
MCQKGILFTKCSLVVVLRPNKASRKCTGIMHLTPERASGTGWWEASQARFHLCLPKKHLHCTERSAAQVSGRCAARPFRPVGLTARTGCRQAVSLAQSGFRRTLTLKPTLPKTCPATATTCSRKRTNRKTQLHFFPNLYSNLNPPGPCQRMGRVFLLDALRGESR